MLLQSCDGGGNGLPDLKETYGYKDTKPFGASIAYELLRKSYPDHIVQLKKKTFSENVAWISDTASLYVNISKKFLLESEDADALLDYVYKGNTAFIAASEIDTLLLNKMYCREKSFDDVNSMFPITYTNTKAGLVPALTTATDTSFQYFYYPFYNHFSEINNIYGRIAGYNNAGLPNFIVFFWGKGRLFLHCDPRVFSNYFLLQKNNYQYLLQPLAVLSKDPEHIFWDDHYNKVNYKSGGGSTSGFAAIFNNPPLKWAFLILLLLVALFLLFNIRRRQRIIPIIKPVQNSSVAFAEAIAGLYLKEKNNKIIAEKMITYFNEFIRSKYFLNTNNITDDFLLSLSKKTAVPLDKTEILYRTIQQMNACAAVSDMQLLDLNQQIQQFNKYKN